MRLRLKAVNDELAKRGYAARLVKGGGYFYFQFGEAETGWTGPSTCQPLTTCPWQNGWRNLSG